MWTTRRTPSEVRDGLTSDGVLLVVQGEDDMGDMLKPPDWGILGEEECLAACPVRAVIKIFLRQREHGYDSTITVSDYPTPQDLHSISASIIITLLRAE